VTSRLAMMLGLVTVEITLLVAGVMVLPASADLIFGAVDGAGNCIAHVPTIPAATCDSGIALTPLEHWISPSGLTVTSEGSSKTGSMPLNQFLVPFPGGSTESGIGIALPAGGSDHEINNAVAGGNFASLLVTNPLHAFTGTISIDSLQTGEQAEICAEPNATTFGGTPVNCEVTTLNGAVNQVLPLPAAYSAADPWLAVDALTGDVKISDLDVAVTPEPGTVALFLTGTAGLVLARRRRNSA
jgi:hypothetical protein